jgi:hypothetical protein
MVLVNSTPNDSVAMQGLALATIFNQQKVKNGDYYAPKLL